MASDKAKELVERLWYAASRKDAQRRIQKAERALLDYIDELEGALDDISAMTDSAQSYRVFSGLGSNEVALAEDVIRDVNNRAREAREE